MLCLKILSPRVTFVLSSFVVVSTLFLFRALSSNRLRFYAYSPPSFRMLNTSYLLYLPKPTKEEIFGDPIIQQDDGRLLSYIRRHRVHPPPPTGRIDNERLKHYGNPSLFTEQLDEIFGYKTGGFFIEAGANDGVFLSNTLALERDRGWTGLLIEPNKFVFHNLKKLRRNAWISDACLSISSTPQNDVAIVHYVGRTINRDRRGGSVVEQSKGELAQQRFIGAGAANVGVIPAGKTDCFPLYSILLAIGMTKVDYFSLDVQGIELKILRTIPFDKVKVNVISVEHNLIPEGKEAMREFLVSVGYRVRYESADDFIFVHNRTQF